MPDTLSVICFGIQGSSNLGSIARVMMNFGLRELLLVQPACSMDSGAMKMACHARTILDNAVILPNLSDLAGRFDLLIGTTGKDRLPTKIKPLTPADGARRIASLPPGFRAGILFGPEDHGLSNEQLKICRWVIRVPTSPGYSSLNIAQACAILLYEFNRPRTELPMAPQTGVEGSATGPDRSLAGTVGPPPSVQDMEQLFMQLRQVLLDAGFLHAQNPERIMFTLRQILSRTGLDRRELTILRGIARQLGWALRQAGLRLRK